MDAKFFPYVHAMDAVRDGMAARGITGIRIADTVFGARDGCWEIGSFTNVANWQYRAWGQNGVRN